MIAITSGGLIACSTGAVALWRIRRYIPPRELLAIARAPGSVLACLTFMGIYLHVEREDVMLDIVMLAVGLGFFATCFVYALGCSRLLRRSGER